jgi:hypothetical protein
MNRVESAECTLLECRRAYELAAARFQLALTSASPREEIRRCHDALKEKERVVFEARRRLEILQSEFQRENVSKRGQN